MLQTRELRFTWLNSLPISDTWKVGDPSPTWHECKAHYPLGRDRSNRPLFSEMTSRVLYFPVLKPRLLSTTGMEHVHFSQKSTRWLPRSEKEGKKIHRIQLTLDCYEYLPFGSLLYPRLAQERKETEKRGLTVQGVELDRKRDSLSFSRVKCLKMGCVTSPT